MASNCARSSETSRIFDSSCSAIWFMVLANTPTSSPLVVGMRCPSVPSASLRATAAISERGRVRPRASKTLSTTDTAKATPNAMASARLSSWTLASMVVIGSASRTMPLGALGGPMGTAR